MAEVMTARAQQSYALLLTLVLVVGGALLAGLYTPITLRITYADIQSNTPQDRLVIQGEDGQEQTVPAVPYILSKESTFFVAPLMALTAQHMRFQPSRTGAFAVQSFSVHLPLYTRLYEGNRFLTFMAPAAGIASHTRADTVTRFTSAGRPEFVGTRLTETLHRFAVIWVAGMGGLAGAWLVALGVLWHRCRWHGMRTLTDLEEHLGLRARADACLCEIKAFFSRNAVLLLGVLAGGGFAYGYEITNLTFSIDEDFSWLTYHMNVDWIAQGRWCMVLFRTLLLPGMEYPFLSAVVGLFFLSLAYVLFVDGHATSLFSRLIFGIVAISSPSFGYIQEFSYMSAFMGCAFFLCAAAFRLFDTACQRRRAGLVAPAVLLLAMAIGTYQSFVYVFFGFVLVDLLVRTRTEPHLGPYIRTMFAALGLAVLALGVYAAINALVNTQPSPYIDTFMQAGNISYARWLTLLAAAGTFFSGQTFAFPEVPYLLAGLGLLALTARHRLATVGICLLFPPYLQGLNVLFFSVMPFRTQLYIPLCLAGVLYVLSMSRSTLGKGAVLAFAFYITMVHASLTTRLFLADTMARQADTLIAARVMGAMYDVCPDMGQNNIPVAFVGSPPEQHNRLRMRDEVFGASFWNWDDTLPYRKYCQLMVQGMPPFSLASSEQQQQAERLAQTMPAWPAKGFVRYEDGLLIVRLGQ